ncbi:MAG: hypothetical protein IKN87_04855 [Bacilli bacterium]|nr:hypothetical protein [Bacilli bacterium]
MEKYKVSFTFGSSSLNNIFINVLLKELRSNFKIDKNGVLLSYTHLSLNKGGMNNIFREHE